MFSKTGLNITFKPGQRTDLLVINGVNKVVQVFPNAKNEMIDWYCITVEENKLEDILIYLTTLPEIKFCEKQAIRK